MPSRNVKRLLCLRNSHNVQCPAIIKILGVEEVE
jgi:hypothetical protein